MVGGKVAYYAGLVAGVDDHDLRIPGKRVDDGVRFTPGRLKPVGADVGGLHAGGGVDYKYDEFLFGGKGGEDYRPRQRQRQQDEYHDLQQEEQIAPEFLKGRIRAHVGHDLPPQHGAGGDPALPAELEYVQQQQRRHKEERQKSRCIQKCHFSSK